MWYNYSDGESDIALSALGARVAGGDARQQAQAIANVQAFEVIALQIFNYLTTY